MPAGIRHAPDPVRSRTCQATCWPIYPRWADTEEQLLINRRAAVDEVRKMIAKKQRAAAKLAAKGGC